MPFLRAERRALERNRGIRELLRGAATIEPLSRRDVAARVAEFEVIPEERRDDVVDAAAEVARFARADYERQRAQREAAWREGGGSDTDEVRVTFNGLEARFRADELTVDLLRRWEIADQLVPTPGFDPFPPEPGEQEGDDRDDAVAADLARIPRS